MYIIVNKTNALGCIYLVKVVLYYILQLPAGKSMLFLGMDNGVIMFLVFSTPLKGLFETPFKKTSGSHQVYLQVSIWVFLIKETAEQEVTGSNPTCIL